MDSKKQNPNETALFESIAARNELPSTLEVQAHSVNSMIFVPHSTMTWKEQAQAYSGMATRYGNDLDEAKKRLKLTELAYWLEGMDSE